MKGRSCLLATGLVLASVSLLACGGSEQLGPRMPAPGVSRHARLPQDLGGAPVEPEQPAASAGPAGTAAPGAEGGPKLRRADILGSGDRIAGLTAVHVGERALLAWTTYAQPTRDDAAPPAPGAGASSSSRKAKPARPQPRAKVLVRLLDKSLGPMSTPVTLSASAESVGGIAAATGRTGRDEACIGWVEADGTSKQIGLALVGKDGKSFARRVQTGGKIAPSDVALAPTGDGWVVAWVDQREGAPQVYAARVTPELKLVGPERRLSHSTGEPSEVQLLAHGETTLVAWNTVDRDRADVYVAALHGAELRAGDETRVGTTKGTAHGVRIGANEDRAVLGWIETPALEAPSRPPPTSAAALPRRGQGHPDPQAPTTSGGEGQAANQKSPHAHRDPQSALEPTDRAVLQLASVDWNGSVLGPPQRVPSSEGARSMAVGCSSGRCRIAVARASAAAAALEVGGLVWNGASLPAQVAPLMAVQEVAPEDVSPVLLDDVLVFGEDTLQGQGRFRKLSIEWP